MNSLNISVHVLLIINDFININAIFTYYVLTEILTISRVLCYLSRNVPKAKPDCTVIVLRVMFQIVL